MKLILMILLALWRKVMVLRKDKRYDFLWKSSGDYPVAKKHAGLAQFLDDVLYLKSPRPYRYAVLIDADALGRMMLYMLTGVPPFYHRAPHRMSRAILYDEPAYPRHLKWPARALLRTLLQRDPGRGRRAAGPHACCCWHRLPGAPWRISRSSRQVAADRGG